MTVGTPGLAEAKELANKLYDDEFGAHYLLGFQTVVLSRFERRLFRFAFALLQPRIYQCI